MSTSRRFQRLDPATRRDQILDVANGLFAEHGYDDVTIESDELTVPHPRIAERRFVLHPLSDVAPERCPADWDDVLPEGGIWPVGTLDELT